MSYIRCPVCRGPCDHIAIDRGLTKGRSGMDSWFPTTAEDSGLAYWSKMQPKPAPSTSAAAKPKPAAPARLCKEMS